MTVRKLIINVFSLLIFTQILAGQSRSYPKHQIGIGYSMISGAGINYQLEPSMKTAFQVYGFAYYFGDEPPDALDLRFNFGAEFQYNFYKSEFIRAYGFAGAGLWYNEDRSFTEEIIQDRLVRTKFVDYRRYFNIGLGAGFEYRFLPRAVIDFKLGIQNQASEGGDDIWIIDPNPDGPDYTGPAFGIGLRFLL